MLLLAVFGDKVAPLFLAFASLLFAFHPIHTEAVNMVVGRTELLAALFGLLTFIFYLRGWNGVALVSFFLALLSKEIAVTVPIMLLLFAWLFGRKIDKKLYLLFGGVTPLSSLREFFAPCVADEVVGQASRPATAGASRPRPNGLCLQSPASWPSSPP